MKYFDLYLFDDLQKLNMFRFNNRLENSIEQLYRAHRTIVMSSIYQLEVATGSYPAELAIIIITTITLLSIKNRTYFNLRNQ